jgi:CHAT domain-containing protein/tetratricopeptide (TPR) repeat protein
MKMRKNRKLRFLLSAAVLLVFSAAAQGAPSADSLFKKALEAYGAQKIDQAAELFGQAGQAYEKGKNNTKAAQSFYNQGLFQLSLTRNEDAAKTFERAAGLYQKAGDVPGESNARIQAAQLHVAAQRWGEARKHYERVLKIAAKNPQFMGWAQEGIGRVQLEESDLDGAEKSFNAAEKNFGSDLVPRLRVRLRRAVIVGLQGNSTEGLKIYDSVIKEAEVLQKDEKTREVGDKIVFQAISDKGELLLRSGWFSEAQKTLEEAVKRGENLFEPVQWELLAAKNNHAQTFMYLGDFDEGEKKLNELLGTAIGSDNAVLAMELNSELGTLARMRGQYGHALDFFQNFRRMADEAGQRKRLAQANIQLASLYASTDAWNTAAIHYQEAFSTALTAGDMNHTLMAMQGIYAGELRGELGLVGKVDYKFMQGIPWRSALTARQLRQRKSAVDEGFNAAWTTVDSLRKDIMAPIPSLDGFRLVREMAWRNAPEIRHYLQEVKSGWFIADAALRVADRRLNMAREAESALRELGARAEEAHEKKYVEVAFGTILNLQRALAGEELLSTPKENIVIQTGGIFVEGTEPEKGESEKGESAVEGDVKTIGAMIAVLSPKAGETETLQKAMIAGSSMPDALKNRLRKALFSRTAQSRPPRDQLEKMLLRLLEDTHPSLKKEAGRLAGEGGKLHAQAKKKLKQQQEELTATAEALLDSVPPYLLLSLDAGEEMLRFFDAWHNMRRRAVVMKELGIVPKTDKDWPKFLKQFAASVGKAKEAFEKSFALTLEKAAESASLEKIAKLRSMADRLTLMELTEEYANLGSLLAAQGRISYEDRLSLLELSARVSRTLSDVKGAEKAARDLLSLVEAPSGSKDASVKDSEVQPEMQWRAYGILADIGEKEKNYSEAVKFYEAALAQMTKIQPLEGTTSQAASDRVALYGGAIRSSFELWKASPSEERAENLWRFLEGMKSRQWRELLATTGGDFLNALPPQSREKVRQLEIRRVALEGAYRQASYNGQREEMDRINNSIREILKERTELTRGQTVDVREIPGLDSIRAMLPDDWGLVNYYISPSLSFAILSSKSAPAEVVPLDVDYDSLFGYSYWMRSAVGTLAEYDEYKFPGRGRPLVTACGLSPEDVGNSLFRPVAGKCGQLRKLLVIPHDVLYVLPFEAMQSTEDDGSASYLISDWTFAELPSAFLLTQTEKIHIPEDDSLLLLANPAYAKLFKKASSESWGNFSREWRNTVDRDPAIGKLLDDSLKDASWARVFSADAQEEERKKFLEGLKGVWNDNLAETEKNTRWASSVKRDFAQFMNPLPGSQSEADSLRGLWEKKRQTPPQTLFAGHASESAFWDSDPGRYRYIHIACHGYDRGSIPDLQPGLALSPVLDVKNDSFLQMGELATVKWNAELITLSACETGLGDLYVGDGMFGLSTVLLAGGAKGAILTRWRAVDESAAEFMPKFYSNILDGQPPVDALRSAQLDLLKGSYPEPRHWAIFKYVGIPW